MKRKVRRAPVQETALVRHIDAFLSADTEVIIRDAANLEEAETSLLESQFSGNLEDVATSYLYLIPPSEKRPAIVGANADFVNQMVRLLNATKKTRMTIADEPPIFQDTGNSVRCIVKAVDKANDDVRWSVKVEQKNSPHADTIALVKAQKKALESLPHYDRRTVARRILNLMRSPQMAATLQAHGIDAQKIVVSGMGAVSQWAELFAKARAKGVKPDAIRAGVRAATGRGLSEVKTGPEIAEAMAAADKVIVDATKSGPPHLVPDSPPEDAAARDKLLHRIYDAIAALNITPSVFQNTLKMQWGKATPEELSLVALQALDIRLQKKLSDTAKQPVAASAEQTKLPGS